MMNWIVVIVSVLLTAFAVYKEIVRANRSRLGLRIAATILAIAALACLILPVSYKADIQNSADKVTLLTPGFNADSLTDNSSKIFTLDSTIAKAHPKAILISNSAEIIADSTSKPTIEIYGNGLSAFDLNQLKNNNIIFHPARVPDGITAVNWTQTISSGELLRVEGMVKNSNKPYRLILKGLNTILDSVNISTGVALPFSLSTAPKHSGRAVYNLIGIRDKDTLFTEQLPVIIQPSQPLKVLMLSAAPDFENKFLRNWLGNNNYAVASRAIITKGKIGQDYFNMERIDLSHITFALLSKFDIVEADLSAIKTLTPAENSTLQQEVTNKGLGLIIRADTVDDKTSSWVQSNFKVLKSAKQPATELLIQGKKTSKLAVDPNFIAQQSEIQPIVTDVHGNLLSSATISGSGKLAFSTINNTYSWELAGDHDDYAAYWSALIDKVTRKARAVDSWSVETPFPVPGEPVNLQYHTASLNGAVKINDAIVAPIQNPGIPFEWSFTYRSKQTGWQQAITAGNAPYWWYVWPKNSWPALRAAENTCVTTQYASKTNKRSSINNAKLQKEDVAISKFYFYILLLVALAYLWAESKYSTTH